SDRRADVLQRARDARGGHLGRVRADRDRDDLPILRRRVQPGAPRPGQRHRQGDLAARRGHHERTPVHQRPVRVPVRPEPRGAAEAPDGGDGRGQLHAAAGVAPVKLTTITHVSVDGVMQGLGGADEDRSGGFARGGWALPLLDDEGGTFVNQVFQRADAFLLGRRTYEIWAPYWGAIADPGNPIAAALNARPKYVASTTLADPTWANTTVLSGDVAAAVGELKARPGGELQVHGSGKLVRWLLDNDLVDEMTLLVVPVVLGQGARLFPDAGPDIALDLIESRADSKGVTIQVYRPTGRPRYPTATADHNDE